MLKKVKNLTSEEIKKFCDKQEFCANCPLKLYPYGSLCIMDIKEKIEMKIEVEK